MQGLADLLQAVKDISVRENSRRTGASHDLTTHLPADVLTILTTMDEQETIQVQARDDAHQRFVTVVEKYLTKFIAEQNKHKDKMDELAVSGYNMESWDGGVLRLHPWFILRVFHFLF